jgi:hypothetical protein
MIWRKSPEKRKRANDFSPILGSITGGTVNNKKMIMWTFAGTLALVILLLAVTGVWAESDQTNRAAPSAPSAVFSDALSFQGRLLDSAGDPVDGSPMMTFRVYTQAVGGSPMWEDAYNVPVENGLFNAGLEIPPVLFDGQALWLGVHVEGDAQEMQPRQQLLPAPYALYAKRAPWDGLVGVPSDLADGDDDTLYSAGTGLSLVGTQFSIILAYRLPQGCTNGAIAEWNAASGTWDCGTDDVGGSAAAWLLGGNTGTSPGMDVLGTTDAASLTLVVNGVPALRLEPATIPNLIGGYWGNGVTSGVRGATIGGGGGSSDPNRVTDDYGTVGGGAGNQAGDGSGTSYDAAHATVGGGLGNTASYNYATVSGGYINIASGNLSTVGGGTSNTASGGSTAIGGGENNVVSGHAATVGGGWGNIATASYANIGGGYGNTASGDYGTTISGGENNTTNGTYATIGGGYTNIASGYLAVAGGGYGNTASGTFATIGGGEVISATGYAATVPGGSYITATGDYAVVGGGRDNVVTGTSYATIGGGYHNAASGSYATVGGGANNAAGSIYAAVAGGYRNTASGGLAAVGGGHGNTASGTSATIGGGTGNDAGGDYATVAGGQGNYASGDYSFAAGRQANAAADGCFTWGDSTDAAFNCSSPDRFMVRASGGVYLHTKSDLSTGAYLAPNSGSWSSLSDRNAKENFQGVDPEHVLEQVAQMPVSTWNYIGETEGIRHLGPMAQDFYAAFGLGDSERYINTLDADGVALAAIQGLYAKNQALEAENAALQTRVDDLETRLTALERAGTPRPVSTLTPWWPLAGLVVLAGIVVARRRR